MSLVVFKLLWIHSINPSKHRINHSVMIDSPSSSTHNQVTVFQLLFKISSHYIITGLHLESKLFMFIHVSSEPNKEWTVHQRTLDRSDCSLPLFLTTSSLNHRACLPMRERRNHHGAENKCCPQPGCLNPGLLIEKHVMLKAPAA